MDISWEYGTRCLKVNSRICLLPSRISLQFLLSSQCLRAFLYLGGAVFTLCWLLFAQAVRERQAKSLNANIYILDFKVLWGFALRVRSVWAFMNTSIIFTIVLTEYYMESIWRKAFSVSNQPCKFSSKCFLSHWLDWIWSFSFRDQIDLVGFQNMYFWDMIVRF